MNPAQMAGAAQAPQQAPQQPPQQPQQAPQQAPTGVGNVQVTPDSAQAADPTKVTQAVELALKQVVDKNGYVDMNKLIILWPQVAKQVGLNIPFMTVLQMFNQDPSMLEGVIQQMGLAGIIVNGKAISADELLQHAQNSVGSATGSPAQAGAAATGA